MVRGSLGKLSGESRRFVFTLKGLGQFLEKETTVIRVGPCFPLDYIDSE